MAEPPPLYVDPLRAALERAVGHQYEIVRLLGRGGMGAVYLGLERFLERQVAIKILPADAARDPDMLERFRREARTAAQLSHPHIVPLHTYGEAEGMPYFVMGFVRGEGLAGRLARQGRLQPEQVRRLLSEVADALDYAHRRGVVHRDIKPDNILIEEETGRAVLADFGIARRAATTSTLTAIGSIVGTPYYMSPEQATGDPSLDGRSDLYSLGVVGFELLAGQRPFVGDSVQALLAQHVTQPPPPLAVLSPGASPSLIAAIERCLAKRPEHRWSDGRKLIDALAVTPEVPLSDQMPVGAERLPSIGILTTLITIVAAYLATTPGSLWAIGVPLGPLRTILKGAILLLGPLGFLNSAIPARNGGWSWSRVFRTAFLAPASWASWWPRSLRRPGDVWPRLPDWLRYIRGTGLLGPFPLVSVLLFYLCFAPFPGMRGRSIIGVLAWLVPGLSNDPKTQVLLVTLLSLLLLALGAVLLVVVPIIIPVAIAHRQVSRNALPKSYALRFLTASNLSSFWSRPEIAALLLPGEGTVVDDPSDPAVLRGRIGALAASAGVTGLWQEGVIAADRLVAAIDAIDREAARVRRDAAPDRLQAVDRQLAELVEGEEAPAQSEMRQLLEGQRRLLGRLVERGEELARRRLGLAELLRTLWLQLATLRAEQARDQLSDLDLTGRVRSLAREIEAHVAGAETVRTLLGGKT